MQVCRKLYETYIEPIETQENRISRLATSFLRESFKTSLTPKQAFRDETLEKVRQFLKQIPASCVDLKEVQELKIALLAAKLGISKEAFDHNEGLLEFAEKYKLYNYLATYDHKLEEDSSHKIQILKGNQFVNWEPIKSGKADYRSGKVPWVFGPDGLQEEVDMYEFTELKPFKKEDPALWGHRTLFEFCACSEGTFDNTHSWFRLYKNTGEIYSVGLYRGAKRNCLSHVTFPFRLHKAKLMSPDVSEFWPCEIRSIPVEITEEAFFKIKNKVESDKKRDELTLQTVGDNCLMYVKSCGSLAGISLETEEDAVSFLIPKSVKNVIGPVSREFKQIGFLASYPLINTIQLVLGAWYVDDALKGSAVRPKFSRIHHPFLPKFAKMNHPYTLFDRAYHSVREWREKEGEEAAYKLPTQLF
jgi:hypothetical protein